MITFSTKRYGISIFLIILITSLLVYISMDLKEIKLDRENIFFWGIVAVLAELIVFFSLYNSHKKIVSNLKRISEINNLSHPYSQKLLKPMGVIGKEIEHMLNEQNNTSILRANRISALNSLVKTLCAGYSEPVIITDVNGSIQSISETLRLKINKNDSDASLLLQNLNDFRSDIPLIEVLSYLEKQKLPWSNPEMPGVICTPVFDKENILNFCIWEFESEMFNKQFKMNKNMKLGNKTRGTVQGMMSKFRKKDKPQ